MGRQEHELLQESLPMRCHCSVLDEQYFLVLLQFAILYMDRWFLFSFSG